MFFEDFGVTPSDYHARSNQHDSAEISASGQSGRVAFADLLTGCFSDRVLHRSDSNGASET